MSQPESVQQGGGTASSTATIIRFPIPRPTFASLAIDAGALRDQVGVTTTRVEDVHRRVQLGALDERTSILALREPAELLEDLGSERGLSWAVVSRLVGVSDAAVRKWRRGESIRSENRRAIARISALLEMLQDPFPVEEPASWLEMRISDDATVTPVDLYAAGRADLIFELVGRRQAPHEILDAFDAQWRTHYRRDHAFVVVDGPDGSPVIVQRRDV